LAVFAVSLTRPTVPVSYIAQGGVALFLAPLGRLPIARFAAVAGRIFGFITLRRAIRLQRFGAAGGLATRNRLGITHG